VADAVGDPSEHVKDRVGVCREDVGKVRSVENVFERRENSNPDVRAILGRNKPIKSIVSKRSRMINWTHDFPISIWYNQAREAQTYRLEKNSNK